MAEQRRTSSSWLRISWRSQPDGSFLLRPLGASPLVFQTDAPTKERLVRFVRAYHAWQFWGLLLSGLVTMPVIANFWQDRFWWACAADLGLCWFLSIAFLWTGELAILRSAIRVPTAAWPGTTTAAPSAGWRRILVALACVLLLIAVAEGPQYLPFFPLMWIAPVLTVAVLVLLVRMHLAEQRAIAESSGAAPAPSPVNPATRPRRILLGSLTGALANPIAALLLINHLISDGAKPLLFFSTVGLLLALSGGCGLLLGLYFLLTRGSGGIRWHLTVAAIAIPELSGILYFAVYGSVTAMHDLAIWLSFISAAAIAFPVAATFWLIARPERYA